MLKNFGVFFNLSYLWNFGSLLGMILVIQILSGLLLVFFYSNNMSNSFSSVQYIMMESNSGWVFRLLHFNNVSFFFLIILLHILKGLLFFSYRLKEVWFVGMLMLIILMLVSFLGYVIVNAQMSFWAGIVITSLVSVIPIIGMKVIYFLWGSFIFSENIVKFFFLMHFILPFFIFILVGLHLFFLHKYGSTSKLFVHKNYLKLNFFPFFWYKDLVNLLLLMVFLLFFLKFPFKLSDPLMFEEVDSLSSPVHIVPEWYFLFAYGILRSIPNKMLGVFLLIFSLMIFFIFLLKNIYLTCLDIFNKFFVIFFIFILIFLSFLGGCPLEQPFLGLGLFFSMSYFCFVILMILNFFFVNFLFIYM